MLSDNKRAISSVQLLDLLEMYFTKFCQLPACLYNYCTACFRRRCLSQLRMQLQIKYFLILLNQSLTQGKAREVSVSLIHFIDRQNYPASTLEIRQSLYLQSKSMF